MTIYRRQIAWPLVVSFFCFVGAFACEHSLMGTEKAPATVNTISWYWEVAHPEPDAAGIVIIREKDLAGRVTYSWNKERVGTDRAGFEKILERLGTLKNTEVVLDLHVFSLTIAGATSSLMRKGEGMAYGERIPFFEDTMLYHKFIRLVKKNNIAVRLGIPDLVSDDAPVVNKPVPPQPTPLPATQSQDK